MTPAEHVSIRSPSGILSGMLHRAENPVTAAVICPPLFEEKKTSYRTLRNLSELLARNSIPSLRFDLFGTGDSEGSFEQADADMWLKDIEAASEFIRKETGADRLCLTGLRTGASLAAHCECDFLVMWQPVLNMPEFVTSETRRQTMRSRLIDERDEKAAADEMDGYSLTGRMKQGLEKLTPIPRHNNCLLVQISHTEKALPEFQEYCGSQSLKTIRMKPFWNRIGHVDTSPLTELTANWLNSKQKRA